jgi:hypothetical protein
MNQPVERKTDADATGTNQFDVTGIFCGKLFTCPERTLRKRAAIEETRIRTGLFTPTAVKLHSSMAALRGALRPFGEITHRACNAPEMSARRLGCAGAFVKRLLKMKDPSGGTTGRVKP